jgi:hypothetical protein
MKDFAKHFGLFMLIFIVFVMIPAAILLYIQIQNAFPHTIAH